MGCQPTPKQPKKPPMQDPNGPAVPVINVLPANPATIAIPITPQKRKSAAYNVSDSQVMEIHVLEVESARSMMTNDQDGGQGEQRVGTAAGTAENDVFLHAPEVKRKHAPLKKQGQYFTAPLPQLSPTTTPNYLYTISGGKVISNPQNPTTNNHTNNTANANGIGTATPNAYAHPPTYDNVPANYARETNGIERNPYGEPVARKFRKSLGFV